MTIRRRQWHRAVFAGAGLYNISWGVWSAANPQWLFSLAGMPPSNYPALFACLAMMVGLYGILYLDVARAPERGWLIAAVGLTGKILGPLGLVWQIWRNDWPASTLVLCVTNDFIWWMPFGLYLHDAFRVDKGQESGGRGQGQGAGGRGQEGDKGQGGR